MSVGTGACGQASRRFGISTKVAGGGKNKEVERRGWTWRRETKREGGKSTWRERATVVVGAVVGGGHDDWYSGG